MLLRKILQQKGATAVALILLVLLILDPVLASSYQSTRTFVGYSVYKGKAAMVVKPVAPTFNVLPHKNRVLSKDGGMLIEIAPISGVREYDWTKKATFLLDPSECGEILCFHEMKAATEVSFLHDTFMGGNFSHNKNTYPSYPILKVSFTHRPRKGRASSEKAPHNDYS